MRSEWKVSSQTFGNLKIFQVYRIRNANEIDHSGNREYTEEVWTDRESAQAYADELNRKGEESEKEDKKERLHTQ